jgi:uncharacterized protein YciI
MAEHAPGKDFYIVDTRLKDGVSTEQMMEILPEHLEYQIAIEKNGSLFAAGPVIDEDGNRVGGIIVYRADDFAAARKIADADPMHARGIRTYSINKWTVNEGGFTVRINYSDRFGEIE